jgi:hypothetical protein
MTKRGVRKSVMPKNPRKRKFICVCLRCNTEFRSLDPKLNRICYNCKRDFVWSTWGASSDPEI